MKAQSTNLIDGSGQPDWQQVLEKSEALLRRESKGWRGPATDKLKLYQERLAREHAHAIGI